MKKYWKRIIQTARLMVGVGDYDVYLIHCRTHHPAHTPMTREQYFIQRMQARYPGKDGKINRCPC